MAQKIQIKLTLEKPARKSGGDKYSGSHKTDKGIISELSLYVPQTISRVVSGSIPTQQMMMTLEF